MQYFLLRNKDGFYLTHDLKTGWGQSEDPKKALRLPKKKAQNVLKSNIRQEEQGNWSILPETVQTDGQAPSLGEMDWGQLIAQIEELYRQVGAYDKSLRQLNSEADMEICDLLHYIEFSSLNAAKGYEAYRMLREALVRRRQIKDESCRASVFRAGRPEDFLLGRVERQMNGLARREYTPRIRRDLFEGVSCERREIQL